MQIVEVDKEYYPLSFPQSIRGETLEYHKRGEGYKKTKKYRVLEDAIPDRWTPLTWLEIIQIHDKYGLNCSLLHAECKVAGIVAERNVLARYHLFTKAKHLLKPADADFFEILPTDSRLAIFGLYSLDVPALDKRLSAADPEYDDLNCTYKGKTCSLATYILTKYGARRKLIIDAMLQ
jgi:hypothetical protein